MFHTLNKAWATILVKQSLENKNKMFLFVCDKNNSEAIMITDLLEQYSASGIYMTNYTLAQFFKVINSNGNDRFPMFDDILVSKNIHDCMLLDFLSKHCKRRCC